jgi:hypothetical protein
MTKDKIFLIIMIIIFALLLVKASALNKTFKNYIEKNKIRQKNLDIYYNNKYCFGNEEDYLCKNNKIQINNSDLKKWIYLNYEIK